MQCYPNHILLPEETCNTLRATPARIVSDISGRSKAAPYWTLASRRPGSCDSCTAIMRRPATDTNGRRVGHLAELARPKAPGWSDGMHQGVGRCTNGTARQIHLPHSQGWCRACQPVSSAGTRRPIVVISAGSSCTDAVLLGRPRRVARPPTGAVLTMEASSR